MFKFVDIWLEKIIKGSFVIDGDKVVEVLYLFYWCCFDKYILYIVVIYCGDKSDDKFVKQVKLFIGCCQYFVNGKDKSFYDIQCVNQVYV